MASHIHVAFSRAWSCPKMPNTFFEFEYGLLLLQWWLAM